MATDAARLFPAAIVLAGLYFTGDIGQLDLLDGLPLPDLESDLSSSFRLGSDHRDLELGYIPRQALVVVLGVPDARLSAVCFSRQLLIFLGPKRPTS